MGAVQVEFLARLRTVAGSKTLSLTIGDNETISTLLSRLVGRLGGEFQKAVFDEGGQIRREVIIRHNGENIVVRRGLATDLRDGDVVTLMNAVAGG
jgi:MoaD family protein